MTAGALVEEALDVERALGHCTRTGARQVLGAQLEDAVGRDA
jgi:hypothetical protein